MHRSTAARHPQTTNHGNKDGDPARHDGATRRTTAVLAETTARGGIRAVSIVHERAPHS
jgi:hypothetical protein